MSILRLPVEILALIAESADIESFFNLSLTSPCLKNIRHDPYIGRLALKKAGHSTEALEAQATEDFARGFRRLAKRRMAVRSAEPWTVVIVAMADCFIYTNGYLCYTINKEHLRILNVRYTLTTELTVNIPLLMQYAVRGFNESLTYTFQPLHCAEGILSCLATQIQGETTRRWLMIFEAREIAKWVVVKRISHEHLILIWNNKEYLFCITKSHERIDGSYRWGIQQLNLRTRRWSDGQIILWELDGSKAGKDICFEIIDRYFYCVSLERRPQTDYELQDRFYQAVRFPVNQATPESLEKPPQRHLWRRHDSEGLIDKRWTSLQLIKDENTGDISIVEIRQEWPSGSARSQRTCYKKRLEFDQVPKGPEVPHLLMLPVSNRNSPTDPEWECKEDFRVRHCGNIHVGDNQSDATAYAFTECPIHTYNPSCDAFVDLVCEAHSTGPLLQLRVRPKMDAVDLEHEQTVKLWPGKPSPSQPDGALDQIHEILNPSRISYGVEWAMDERILVYSPELAPGQLRPITLLSFDPGLQFPGFPKHPSRTTNAGHASVVLPGTPPPSPESACGSPDDVVLPPSTGRSGEWLPSGGRDESTSLFIKSGPPLYQKMSTGDGAQHGFDMSYDPPTELLV